MLIARFTLLSLLATTFSVSAEVATIPDIAIGEQTTARLHACNKRAGDDDWDYRSEFTISGGFIVLDAVGYTLEGTGEDSYIKQEPIYSNPVAQRLPQQVLEQLDVIADAYAVLIEDPKTRADFRILILNLGLLEAISSSDVARVPFHCHAEGHRYSGDEKINGGIEVKLERRFTVSDFRNAIATLSRFPSPYGASELDFIRNEISDVVGSQL